MQIRGLLALGAIAIARCVSLPSCEADTEAHCLGESADLSNEGIMACLKGLAAPSTSCTDYLRLLGSCEADISGVCRGAHQEGETMACLIQRTPKEQLSDSCVAALPEEEEPVGLHAKYWAGGKRELAEEELEDLNEDDYDTYQRWIKKKKGRKTEKQKERDFAVRTQKKAAATKAMEAEALAAAKGALSSGNPLTAAVEAATREGEAAVAADKTDTLKPFTKGAIQAIAKAAVKEARAQQAKGEL